MTHEFIAKWGAVIALILAIGPMVLFLIVNRLGDSGPWPRMVRFLVVLEAILMLGLFSIGGGIFLIRLGLYAGEHYRHVDPRQRLSFVIDSMDATEGLPFPSYSAVGLVRETDEIATIIIRGYTYKHRKTEDVLRVFSTNLSEPRYVWEVLYDEASPLLTVFTFTFSWRLLLGIFILVSGGALYCGTIWYHVTLLKREPADPTLEERLDRTSIDP